MPNRTIHFVCGLPRSGSTLLCNILAQNPLIHTTPTSGCHETLFCVRNQWHQWIEHKAATSLSADHNLQRVLNAMLYSYHDTERPVVIDKGRGWTSLLEMMEFALGREAKVIVPVRSIAQIVASFEKLHRKQAVSHQDTGDYFTAQTVEGRTNQLLAGDAPLGLAYNRLKDVFQRGFSDRLFLVEFDYLTHKPKETMAQIYAFLGMEAFEHDFENVEQYTSEDDAVHGMDLHAIRKSVKPVLDDSLEVLGKDLVGRLQGTEFWR